MSTDRVDKAWQRKGLKDYSTEAIIGTLGHYGIQVNEADFRDRKSTRLNSSHSGESRMPSSA